MRKYLILFLALALLSASSCSTYRRVAYLKDMEVGVEYDVLPVPKPIIRVNDKLKILVTASNPALAAPFNLSTGSHYTVGEDGTIWPTATMEELKAYLVESDGCINFPVVGRVKVEGLTLEEVKTNLEQKIIETGYVKEPIVLASFQNFEIFMIGPAKSGVLKVEDGCINMFELVARSGEIGYQGVRDDVRVIRTINGKKVAYSINLQSVSAFTSPVFYLQQNDMVYVKPRNRFMDDMTQTAWYTTFSSVLTLITSVAAIYFFLK